MLLGLQCRAELTAQDTVRSTSLRVALLGALEKSGLVHLHGMANLSSADLVPENYPLPCSTYKIV